MFNNQHFC